ncbi:MAG: hypothetical protein ACK4ZJ_13780 [Allorhizobium sp.]
MTFFIIIMWLVYLTTMPWKLKSVYKYDNQFVFKENKNEKSILFRQVKRIYPAFFTKCSPIIIEYSDNGIQKKIAFVPRQSSVILLLPFYKHPLTKELNEEIKTYVNTTLPIN